MMKLTQAMTVTTGLAVGFVVTGSVINQPMLRDMGKLAGMGAISTGFLLKVHSLEKEKQKQFSQFQQHNIGLQAKLSATQAELQKLEKKVQTQNTRQRLYLSSIQKLEHQQKLILKTVNTFEKSLVNTVQPVSSPATHISTKFNQTSSENLVLAPKPVTRVYIDGNNLSFAADSLQIEVDYDALRIELSQNALRTNFKYYTGVHSPISEGQQRFLNYLNHLRYEVIELPILARPEQQTFKTVGDDVKIVVDMMREVKNGDEVILVSGDGDFIPAVTDLQCRNVKVTVVAKKKMLSDKLAQIADVVIYLDDIYYKIAKYKKFDVA
ncbi:NYN domain-containing protein [Nostoc sp. FACHB-110]|uniref:LabA-like NYN domain-containing protein n=1 Tax=Nostoc sp. FACHB-110 TaxID=2692834 RepID=UPI001685E6A1|nr:NYN domain-containing protein [Nostoc sp. FACHB-110]MBD2436241.1 NYN domain-containing protein [Nostoc sp. FACHB-110]